MIKKVGITNSNCTVVTPCKLVTAIRLLPIVWGLWKEKNCMHTSFNKAMTNYTSEEN